MALERGERTAITPPGVVAPSMAKIMTLATAEDGTRRLKTPNRSARAFGMIRPGTDAPFNMAREAKLSVCEMPLSSQNTGMECVSRVASCVKKGEL